MCIDGVLSDPSEIEFGLPQGSIVGPSMFSIYTTPLGISSNNLGYRFICMLMTYNSILQMLQTYDS